MPARQASQPWAVIAATATTINSLSLSLCLPACNHTRTHPHPYRAPQPHPPSTFCLVTKPAMTKTKPPASQGTVLLRPQALWPSNRDASHRRRGALFGPRPLYVAMASSRGSQTESPCSSSSGLQGGLGCGWDWDGGGCGVGMFGRKGGGWVSYIVEIVLKIGFDLVFIGGFEVF